MRWLTPQAAVALTDACRSRGVVRAGSPLVVFAASFNANKLFLVDAATADVHVMLRTRALQPACPSEEARDGVLRWVEDHAALLTSGALSVEEVEAGAPATRGISLFPRRAPQLSSAVTRGVRVEASAVYMPEQSDSLRDSFAYRVRFSLLSLEEQAAAGVVPPVISVQLMSRHWVISDAAGRQEEVRGAGVIGEHPLLLPGAPAYIYQSMTPMRRGPERGGGRMWGSFTFVVGTLTARTGANIEAACAPFPLAVPEFVH